MTKWLNWIIALVAVTVLVLTVYFLGVIPHISTQSTLQCPIPAATECDCPTTGPNPTICTPQPCAECTTCAECTPCVERPNSSPQYPLDEELKADPSINWNTLERLQIVFLSTPE